MVPEPIQLVKYVQNRYNDLVKPLIEAGRHEIAVQHMESLIEAVAIADGVHIINDVKCGAEFFTSAKSLEDALKTGDFEAIQIAQEQFEAYAAQTKLPMQK